MKKRGLVQTVGFTAGPLIASLRENRPDFVVFIASEASMPYVKEALKAFPGLKHTAIRVQDPEDMDEAFRAGRQAYRRLKEEDADELLADPTGGTKTMVAGLALALAGLGFTFVYVGGKKRDQAGRVVTGYEEVRTMRDPTERYHVYEQHAFRLAWNEWRMRAAAAAVRKILEDGEKSPELLTDVERDYFSGLKAIAEGMHAWDLFQHQKAHELLAQGLPLAIRAAEHWGHESKLRVLRDLEQRLPDLQATAKDNLSGHPTFRVLKDLFSNAERRAEVGRYDDALARLYRAVELALEAHFFKNYGFFLNKPQSWPEELRKKVGFREKVGSKPKRIYGLFDMIQRAAQLSWASEEVGTLPLLIYAEQNKLKKLTGDRNKSILAHGVVPVERSAYERFKAFLLKLGLEPAAPWPRW